MLSARQCARCAEIRSSRQPNARRDECAAYVDSVWAWLEGLGTGVRRGDPDTWAPPAWPPSYRGVVNTLEVAHADFVWRVRKHARVRQARRAPPGGDGGVAGSARHPDGQLGFEEARPARAPPVLLGLFCRPGELATDIQPFK